MVTTSVEAIEEAAAAAAAAEAAAAAAEANGAGTGAMASVTAATVWTTATSSPTKIVDLVKVKVFLEGHKKLTIPPIFGILKL